jgi:uncharacterized membrane protein (UPF0127 family)
MRKNKQGKKTMKPRLRYILYVPCFLCLFAGLAACEETPRLKTITLELAGKRFTVEVADTKETRARGLMFRTNLPENSGMLFVFDKDDRYGFWMENTKIPLSLAYISLGGEIREIFDLTPLSRRLVESSYSVRYALEVNQGTFEKLGVKPGYVIKIPRLPDK